MWKITKYKKFNTLEQEVGVSVIAEYENRHRLTYDLLGENLFSKTDEELLRMVLDQFYNEMFPGRAEKEAIEEVKSTIDKVTVETVRGNNFSASLIGDLIATYPFMTEGMYDNWVELGLQPIEIGRTYTRGSFVRILDKKTSKWVCVRILLDNFTYTGEFSILEMAQPYANGFDIRRFNAPTYPRFKAADIQLKTGGSR